MAPRYTDDDVALWYSSYVQGQTLAELAREFGVAEATIQGAFLRRGLPRRPPLRRSATPKPRPEIEALPAARPPFLSERSWRVLLARRSGRTLAEIGRDLGISRQRVAQIEERALRDFEPATRPSASVSGGHASTS